MKITRQQLRRLIRETISEGWEGRGHRRQWAGQHPPPEMTGATLRIDYRSPPSGLGTVMLPHTDGDIKKILIQHEGANPPVSPGIYDQVILFTPMGYKAGEETMQKSSDYWELAEWLKDGFGVTTVVDSEMSFDNVGGADRGIPVDEWRDNITAGW